MADPDSPHGPEPQEAGPPSVAGIAPPLAPTPHPLSDHGASADADEGSEPTSVTPCRATGQRALWLWGGEDLTPGERPGGGLIYADTWHSRKLEGEGAAWQDPEEGAGVAPEDKGAQGGQRRAGLGGSENFIPRALGSHRGWCTGERAVQQGREVGQEPRQQWAPEPRAGSSPNPISCREAGQEPRARLPTFTKEIWAMGAPGRGFCREIRSPPPYSC